MNKMIRYTFNSTKLLMVLLLAVNSLSVMAQYPVAGAGKNGIFVVFDNKLPIGFNYKLERKSDAPDDNWATIYISSAPSLTNQFIYNRLLSINEKLPFYPIPDSVSIERFIALLKGKSTTDSVYIYNAYPPYLEVMGTAFFDNTGKINTKYEYQISKVDANGKVLSTKKVASLSFPGESKKYAVTFSESIASGNKINLRFLVKGDPKPMGFMVFRQNYLQTSFKEIHPFTSYSSTSNGLTMLLTDTLVVPRMIYRYVLIPYDVLGNFGQLSDTILVKNVPKNEEVPFIEDFEAVSNDSVQAIKLRWRATSVQNLRGISIFRSNDFDNGYSLYSHVLPTDTQFVDRSVSPITNYYYYLVFNGAYGDSPATAKVVGMVKALKESLLPPQYPKVTATDVGNLISWQRAENDTKGYYVFRGEGYSNASMQISDLIICDSSAVSFVDSTANLIPGQQYCYAIKALNNSNLLSSLSEEVIANPSKPNLPTPMNLEIRKYNGKALLVWTDMKAISPFVFGYKVWRNEKNSASKQLLTAVNVPIEANTFTDTLLQRGIDYEYFVQAVGIQNSESSLSASFEFGIPLPSPFAPAGLRATKSDGEVVIHWDATGSTEISSYKLYREKLGEKPILLATINATESNYTDVIQNKEGTYFYAISSVFTTGKESAPSDEVGVSFE